MKNWLLFILVVMGLAVFSGCYTPEGGSSIPWNEPSKSDGSFAPTVNF